MADPAPIAFSIGLLDCDIAISRSSKNRIQPSKLTLDARPCDIVNRRREDERRSTEARQLNSHPVNGVRVARNSQLSIALDRLQAA
jgi:hypothetical protein